MPLVVNTNVASLAAQRNLSLNTFNLNRSLERLSSGFRINHAADDAAGLQISETLKTGIRGMQKALQNTQDGVSMLQISEGSLSVIGENLQRVRELTVQAANDTNSDVQRDALELEIQARLRDNQRIVTATQFNGIALLSGQQVGSYEIRLQIGPDESLEVDTLNITSILATTYATAIGLLEGGGANTSAGWGSIGSINFASTLITIFIGGGGVPITTVAGAGTIARAFLGDIDRAISAISSRRALIGAVGNQLESILQNLNLTRENYIASESRVRDLDMAQETANLTKNQILQQASASILAQANQTPSLVLGLLQ